MFIKYNDCAINVWVIMPWRVNNGVRFSKGSPTNDECCICKNPLESNIVGHVNHLFHSGCIGDWFAEQKKHEEPLSLSIWGRFALVFGAQDKGKKSPTLLNKLPRAHVKIGDSAIAGSEDRRAG